MTSLEGASVVVLGATGGIGRAIAAEMDRRGARLTLVARDAVRLAELRVPGGRIAADLRSPEACERVVTSVGEIDVVVNAVGVVAFGALDELSVDAMEELFLTNVFVPIMMMRAALPAMSHGGAIVNISGVIAERNLPGMAAYGASKAALRSFDEAAAREARRRGVRVIDARPPHTETGLSERPIEGTAPRFGTGLSPDHVARVIIDAIVDGTDDLPASNF